MCGMEYIVLVLASVQVSNVYSASFQERAPAVLGLV